MYISALVRFLWQIVTSVQGYEHDNVPYVLPLGWKSFTLTQNRNGKFFLVLNQAPHNEELRGISVLDEGDW
jgi:hypothetical protein